MGIRMNLSKRGAPPVARWLVTALAFFGTTGFAAANTVDQAIAQEDRIAELERTVAILADELERTRRQLAVPDDQPLSSKFGLGPAASKIYDLGRGLSIGGSITSFAGIIGLAEVVVFCRVSSSSDMCSSCSWSSAAERASGFCVLLSQRFHSVFASSSSSSSVLGFESRRWVRISSGV